MNLREYLHQNKMKCTDLAKKINYGSGYINDVLHGRKRAGKKFISILETFSEGRITKNEILEVWEKAPKKANKHNKIETETNEVE